MIIQAWHTLLCIVVEHTRPVSLRLRSALFQVVVEILLELDVGEFVVKLNHRCLLDAMMDLCGVPASKFRPICRYAHSSKSNAYTGVLVCGPAQLNTTCAMSHCDHRLLHCTLCECMSLLCYLPSPDIHHKHNEAVVLGCTSSPCLPLPRHAAAGRGAHTAGHDYCNMCAAAR